ncbi:MAG: 2-iminoacetate synthase ThiH, partial [Deltaproteobacteria bacterium HGW-Deltaproteobacteria-16]
MFIIPEFPALQDAVSRATEAEVLRALGSDRPGLDGLAALLSPAAEPYLSAMAKRSGAITGQRFGRTIQMYAPVYLSSFCTNRCAYCGFSAGN